MSELPLNAHIVEEFNPENQKPDQSGVIPVRRKKGEINVLLITTRTRGRWIIPKGGIEPGMTARSSARKEAFEEAGIRGNMSKDPLGYYLHGESTESHFVEVYLMKVKRDLAKWPEVGERAKQWFTLEEAVEKVDEPGLIPLLRTLNG